MRVAIFIIAFILFIHLFCGCEPIDITDPTPVWYRMALESNTDEFALGDIGVESAISVLEANNVDFTKPIIVKQASFAIERQDLADTTPYFLYIGDILADTVDVADGITTYRFYEKLNESCKDPYWRVRSAHNVMVRVNMLIYAFKE